MTAVADTRTVRAGGPLRGAIRVPGDKSISHRAVMFNAIAEGTAVIRNFLAGEDCLATVRCLRALGVPIVELAAGPRAGGAPASLAFEVRGVGLAGLREPEEILDVGNSGTSIRLLLGLLAGLDGIAVLTGDASIRRRPMGRVVHLLGEMGVRIDGRSSGDRAPLAVRGGKTRAVKIASPVASAQVKSAVLLAALGAEGETSFFEPLPSRDHTERMLAAMGVPLAVRERKIFVTGKKPLVARSIAVPGDLSSAAFWLGGAAVVPGSALRLEGVGLNPTRTGVLDILREMGVRLELSDQAEEAGEPRGDIRVACGELDPVTVGGELLVRAIDEVPIVALLMACARGRSEIRDASELRIKESDRLAAIADALGALGARIQELPDGLAIEGPTRWTGGTIDTHGDHRIAMMCAMAALLAEAPVTIRQTACTETSYPGFWDTLVEQGQFVE